MTIEYKFSPTRYPDPLTVINLFNSAGIGKPHWTQSRMERAMKGSALVISAWDNETLVGYISVISDLAWTGYITQLAVDPTLQKSGIGRKLIDLAQEKLGEEVTLIVHSSDQAKIFYEAYGFEVYSNVYQLKRKK